MSKELRTSEQLTNDIKSFKDELGNDKHVGTRPPKPPKGNDDETDDKHVGTRPPKPPKD